MRPKTLAVLAFVAAAVAAIVIPTIRKHRAESSANERRALDTEIGKYYEQTVKPLLAAESREPDRVTGKLLPVASDGSGLDTSLYGELDPATRTDRLAGAGTLVVVASDATALYSGGATGMAMAANGLTITLFDPATKTVLGRKHFEAPEPPKETNQDGLDFYVARQAAHVAAYLKTLPRSP